MRATGSEVVFRNFGCYCIVLCPRYFTVPCRVMSLVVFITRLPVFVWLLVSVFSSWPLGFTSLCPRGTKRKENSGLLGRGADVSPVRPQGSARIGLFGDLTDAVLPSEGMARPCGQHPGTWGWRGPRRCSWTPPPGAAVVPWDLGAKHRCSLPFLSLDNQIRPFCIPHLLA